MPYSQNKLKFVGCKVNRGQQGRCEFRAKSNIKNGAFCDSKQFIVASYFRDNYFLLRYLDEAESDYSDNENYWTAQRNQIFFQYILKTRDQFQR